MSFSQKGLEMTHEEDASEESNSMVVVPVAPNDPDPLFQVRVLVADAHLVKNGAQPAAGRV